ncbi:MAG: alpha-amylase family glycosyl hydrolase [Bacteroidota bacterium]
MKKLLTGFFALFVFTVSGQVTIEPTFFDQSTEITVVYDATQGTGELEGITPVYMHAGLIVQGSSGWQYVQGNWGTADNNVVMTDQGNNIHTKTYTVADFHSIPGGVTVEELAFVFRNADGSLEGKTEDGSDIFVPLPAGGFEVLITNPSTSALILGENEDFNISAESSELSDLAVWIDGNQVANESNTTSISYDGNSSSLGIGQYTVEVTANNGADLVSDSFNLIIQGEPEISEPPVDVIDGINYIDDNTVILQIHAPLKDFIYVLGDFNDWTNDLSFFMDKRTTDPERWWIQIDNLSPGEEYRFQYEIDGSIRVADIYAEKLLDPWNDQWISNSIYPDLIEYPNSETSNIVSVLETAQEAYPWQITNFQKPDQDNLIIYELLIRDFIEEQSFMTLIDTLDYLENLGINAIELMPINEFEGNDSWGYNPMFYFAPDKYYGPEESMKAFVDECHSRGIAVILDMTLNHSFGLSPMVRMYFDASAGQWGEPSAENPWFNQQAKHDFNVGFDFNHESPHTRAFTKRVLRYWVEEYNIDGYRMDLSKGFTQNNTLGNVGAWGQYDQSRVDIWNDYGNDIWSLDPEVYMILEHFANNSEETVLANSGFMFWGNLNHEYLESAMGYSGNFNWISHQARGWNDPHVVGYMESHDEERMMYKNSLWGNGSGSYQVTNLSTGLDRVELSANFFIPIPGPKMIWQFGELGYDFSINTCSDGVTIDPDCRTANKPIKWDYYQNPDRKKVYKTFAALNKLKLEEPAFRTTDFNLDVNGTGKRIHLNHASMNVTIIGNFDVVPITMVPGFQHTGTWYEYWTGEEIVENDLNNGFLLQPGEYRLYTDVQLELPDLNVSIEELNAPVNSSIYPNPVNGNSLIYIDHEGGYLEVNVLDISGKNVRNVIQGSFGKQLITSSLGLESLSAGIYLVNVLSEGKLETHKIIVD